MRYLLSGEFLESCDCTVICPCWVDDDPVGGHCTGFILWQLDDKSYINGGGIVTEPGDLSGCKVVSVSTHSGKRRRGGATTSVLYVDPGGGEDAEKLVDVLGEAFAGKAGGILEELAEVSGTVVAKCRAAITADLKKPSSKQQPWLVRVKEWVDQDNHVLKIEATGYSTIFDKDEIEDENGVAQPMQLEHTALSRELQAQGPVEAQHGERLTVRVGALPGGNLEVQGRSGMTGKFKYDSNVAYRKQAKPAATAR